MRVMAGRVRPENAAQWILFVQRLEEHQIEPDNVGFAVSEWLSAIVRDCSSGFGHSGAVEVRQLRFTS